MSKRKKKKSIKTGKKTPRDEKINTIKKNKYLVNKLNWSKKKKYTPNDLEFYDRAVNYLDVWFYIFTRVLWWCGYGSYCKTDLGCRWNYEPIRTNGIKMIEKILSIAFNSEKQKKRQTRYIINFDSRPCWIENLKNIEEKLVPYITCYGYSDNRYWLPHHRKGGQDIYFSSPTYLKSPWAVFESAYDNCPICLENLFNVQRCDNGKLDWITTQKCGHRLHAECHYQLFLASRRTDNNKILCPLCRAHDKNDHYNQILVERKEEERQRRERDRNHDNVLDELGEHFFQRAIERSFETSRVNDGSPPFSMPQHSNSRRLLEDLPARPWWWSPSVDELIWGSELDET